MLVGLHVPTNFQMYRQISEKSIMGGGGAIAPLPPPPPSGYASGGRNRLCGCRHITSAEPNSPRV